MGSAQGPLDSPWGRTPGRGSRSPRRPRAAKLPSCLKQDKEKRGEHRSREGRDGFFVFWGTHVSRCVTEMVQRARGPVPPSWLPLAGWQPPGHSPAQPPWPPCAPDLPRLCGKPVPGPCSLQPPRTLSPAAQAGSPTGRADLAPWGPQAPRSEESSEGPTGFVTLF